MKKIRIFFITIFIVGCSGGSDIYYSNLDIFSECRDINPIIDGVYISCDDLDKDCIKDIEECKNDLLSCKHFKLLSKKNIISIMSYDDEKKEYGSGLYINFLAKYNLENNKYNNVYLFTLLEHGKEDIKIIIPLFIEKGIIKIGDFLIEDENKEKDIKTLRYFIKNNIDEEIITSYSDKNEASYEVIIKKEESIKKIALFQSKKPIIHQYLIPFDIEKPIPEAIIF